MTESNGKSDSVLSDLVLRIHQDEEKRRERCLSDLLQDAPNLRNFLIGRDQDGKTVPAGVLTIEAGDGVCQMSLKWYAFSLEATYTGASWYGLLETIEIDMQEGTTNWRSDYRKKRARQEAIRKAVE